MSCGAIRCCVVLNGQEAVAIVDGGAGLSLVPRNSLSKYSLCAQEWQTPTIIGIEGVSFAVPEACLVEITVLGRTVVYAGLLVHYRRTCCWSMIF